MDLAAAIDPTPAHSETVDVGPRDATSIEVAPSPLRLVERAPDIRRIRIYEAHAAFELIEELEFLTRRSVESNVFFSPRFLVPAMPRLDERTIRLMVARDEGQGRSRLRFLMPFSVEGTGLFGGRPVLRAWTHPFGRLGTLPLDRDDPAETAASLFAAMRDPEHALPDVLVLPDLALEGEMAEVMLRTAATHGLSVAISDRSERAVLDATGSPVTFLRDTLGAKGLRDHRRRLRRLGIAGPVAFEVAATPDETRVAFEEFLTLEVSGWKGRARSALADDRHRAAFAREAVHGLSAQGRVRIYTLRAGPQPVASLVVLVSEGQAVAWKTAFDETHRSAGPGSLMMALASEAMIADPAIRRVDSCAMPDHRIANRLWRGRMTLGTMVIGLGADAGRRVEQVSRDLQAHRLRLQRRRLLRRRVARIFGRP